MTRAQLEHIIRAAGTIADVDELVVIGSQAILGEFPNAPAELLVSNAAGVYPRHHPERGDLIDSTIGEGSPFQKSFGYYAHGVDESTALLPDGWKDRLILVCGENTRFVRGWCLEAHDLAIAKHIAGREKDREFTRLLARHGMVSREVLERRLAATAVDAPLRDLVLARIHADFSWIAEPPPAYNVIRKGEPRVMISRLPSVLFVVCLAAAGATLPKSGPLPGMPPVLDPHDIYSADHAGLLSPVVKNFPNRVYVPNTVSNTVSVIDPATYKVIDTFKVGRLPQHVTPSYDLKTLWVLNDMGNSLTEIDPATGKKGKTIKVEDPYNMYYTPDGKYAIVVAEQRMRLMFRDAQTMELKNALWMPCKGVDHMDFSADGRYLIASCEFAGKVVKVDVASQKMVGVLPLEQHGMPQDVKLSPDGRIFYVADMMANGVYLIDGDNLTKVGFLPTGKGTHGLYASRDSKVLYVSNRGEGSISVIDFATRKIVKKWSLPGGGSPDMGGVSADGKVLWLSGRYNSEVYAIDTSSGRLLARIPVGHGPHGLCVYPQPGRYSLGHTGVFR